MSDYSCDLALCNSPSGSHTVLLCWTQYLNPQYYQQQPVSLFTQWKTSWLLYYFLCVHTSMQESKRIWCHFKFIYYISHSNCHTFSPQSVLFVTNNVTKLSTKIFMSLQISLLVANLGGYTTATRHGQKAGPKSYTSRTALMQPSFSGLFVTWAYLPKEWNRWHLNI